MGDRGHRMGFHVDHRCTGASCEPLLVGGGRHHAIHAENCRAGDRIGRRGDILPAVGSISRGPDHVTRGEIDRRMALFGERATGVHDAATRQAGVEAAGESGRDDHAGPVAVDQQPRRTGRRLPAGSRHAPRHLPSSDDALGEPAVRGGIFDGMTGQAREGVGLDVHGEHDPSHALRPVRWRGLRCGPGVVRHGGAVPGQWPSRWWRTDSGLHQHTPQQRGQSHGSAAAIFTSYLGTFSTFSSPSDL